MLAFTVLFVLLPDDLNSLVAWQAAVAIPIFLACSALVGKLPPERRTRGSLAFRYACLAWALLWTLYIPAFLVAGPDSSGATGFLGWLTRYNSYIDVLFQFLLGFGMILAVLDDVYREGESARQARLAERRLFVNDLFITLLRRPAKGKAGVSRTSSTSLNPS